MKNQQKSRTCKNCIENDCGICDRFGVWVSDSDICLDMRKHQSLKQVLTDYLDGRKKEKMPNAIEHRAIKIEVYEYIVNYINKHTYAPSTHEISEHIGIAGNTVRKCIHELIDEEILASEVREGDLNRAYRINGTKAVKKK